jgi:tRNA pseudouridine38-40 synthase
LTTFRLTLEYDGTDFEGWQAQSGAHRTVQGVLESALARLTGQCVRVAGAGRTDSGVHAEGQVASLRLESRFAADGLRRALNGVLPPDLAVRDAAQVPEGFHARFDARGKLYRYTVWNGRSPSPLRARTVLSLQGRLDLEAMRAAAALLQGTHDFACFQAAGSLARSTVRTLSRVEVEGESRGEVRLWVEGDGFLRHMVRAVAGTLLEVGRGRRRPEGLPALLAARDRTRAGPNAAARGLCLVRVFYDSDGKSGP